MALSSFRITEDTEKASDSQVRVRVKGGVMVMVMFMFIVWVEFGL